jgi:hypothetical protein
MKCLMETWGNDPMPPGLPELYIRARKLKGSTDERAVWVALRMYLLSRGQPMNLCRDELPALVARARRA